MSSSLLSLLRPRPALLVAATLLLGAELCMRALAPDGGVPYALGLQEYRSLVRELADGDVPEVVVLGSSRTREGVLSRELAAELEARTGNALRVGNYSLAGAHATEVELVVERLLGADKLPQLVLYGVGPRQLLVKARPHVNASLLWDVSSWTRARAAHGAEVDDFMGRAVRNSAAEFSWLVRFRHGIHGALTGNSKRGTSEELRRAVQASRGQRYNPMRGKRPRWQQKSPKRSRKISRKSATAYLRRVTGPGRSYEMAPEQLERLRNSLHQLDSHGVPVVLFAVPIADVLQSVLPEGLMAEFEGTMNEVASSSGTLFLSAADLAVTYRRKDFREQSHLNLRGAKKLTRALSKHAAAAIEAKN